MANLPNARASNAMNAYAEGDDSAFAVVYGELSPRLLGYAVRATGSTRPPKTSCSRCS